MTAVTLENGIQQVDLDIGIFRFIGQGTQVFGKAGSPERVSRLQVVGREVELRILAEDLHHPMTVDTKRLAERSYLIGKRHFESMEAVASVFHHLRLFDPDREHRRIEMRV